MFTSITSTSIIKKKKKRKNASDNSALKKSPGYLTHPNIALYNTSTTEVVRQQSDTQDTREEKEREKINGRSDKMSLKWEMSVRRLSAGSQVSIFPECISSM